ncbi:Rid family hydrolase [Streptomyces flavovirens]|uniref:Rid family hydrolase n=1 Tax=Streptomyces TaxID=1883 RepID=UPI00081B06ED|nr:Rid family hydrolase [Streptomyces sp. BpilaLS-43]SCD88770.1 Enamine deaminase RidA, house cleaning of reactive enamine intermediates, YjgF/YER057c/UK114 family [Streptomyces sp. BpilaLS-43]
MGVHEIGPRMVGERLMYNRAVRVESPLSWLFVSGHEARDDDGTIACTGDMAGQMRLALQRLGQTVTEAGMTMADVVQLRVFTTDLADCKAHYRVLMDELAAVRCRPTSLLAEVSALSDPDMLIEIEGMAVRCAGDPQADRTV